MRERSVSREIQSIRRSLSSIGNALRRLLPPLRRLAAAQSDGITRRRAKLKLSPQRRAALKLQGQYMGNLRNLKPRQKARVRAVRKASGLRASIRLAKRLART